MDIHESNCQSCGDVVDCRVWLYDGKEYSEPPEALIIDSILKRIYGEEETINVGLYLMPENVKVLYQNMRKHKGMEIL